jgi:hypothetical protein
MPAFLNHQDMRTDHHKGKVRKFHRAHESIPGAAHDTKQHKKRSHESKHAEKSA